MAHSHAHRHAHGHAHGHHHGSDNLRLAFWLNLGFALVELIGGLLTNSMAILADALHDLGDSIAIGLAWRMERYARKGATEKYSYGHRRFSLLAALINALILIVGGLFVLSEAVPRLLHPEPVHAGGMLALAVLGVLVNGYAALRVRTDDTHNARMIAWHLYEDVLGWLAVLIVAVVMLFRPLPILDPLLSVLITLYVVYNVMKHLRSTLSLFLQAVPEQLSLTHIEQELLAIPAVRSCHHTRLWSLDGSHHVLTSHVVVDADTPTSAIAQIKQAIQQLAQRHDLVHTTIEIDYADEACSMAGETDHRTETHAHGDEPDAHHGHHH